MARGHRLNTSIVLAAVHGLSGLFRAVSEVEPSLFRPLPPPPLSPSLISHLASVDVKQHGPKNCATASVCESGGGRPGLPVPDSPYGLCGRKATLNELQSLRGGRPGLPVPDSPYGLCGRKATLDERWSQIYCHLGTDETLSVSCSNPT